MRTIIAGSRSITDYNTTAIGIESAYFIPTIILSGTANGPDQHGERYGLEHGIFVRRYPADWNNLGKGAGYIRNIRMGHEADALIAIWDGKSKGTLHMIKIAESLGCLIYIYIPHQQRTG